MYSILFQQNSTEYLANTYSDLSDINAKETDTAYVVNDDESGHKKGYYVYWCKEWKPFNKAI